VVAIAREEVVTVVVEEVVDVARRRWSPEEVRWSPSL
jgi:hypothetical protein